MDKKYHVFVLLFFMLVFSASCFGLKSSKILGGQDCWRSYQVSLTIHLKNGRKSLCGGSIISPGYILTAAHCSESVQYMTIGFGSPNRTQPLAQVNSTKIQAHPKWNSTELIYDCALVSYDPAKIRIDGRRIGLIRLPGKSQLNQEFTGETAEVSGWGRTKDWGGKPTEILQCLNGSILDNESCGRHYGDEMIQSQHICLKGKWQKSACNGDSGGPLTIREADDGLTQIGIVSFGSRLGCGWGIHGVYARVTSCLEWILQTTKIPQRP